MLPHFIVTKPPAITRILTVIVCLIRPLSLDSKGHSAVAAATAAGVGSRPPDPISCPVPPSTGTAEPARCVDPFCQNSLEVLTFSHIYKTDIMLFFFFFFAGLLSTPNLIPLPQQNQGSLLSAQTRMGLQAQVQGNFEAFFSGKEKPSLSITSH